MASATYKAYLVIHQPATDRHSFSGQRLAWPRNTVWTLEAQLYLRNRTKFAFPLTYVAPGSCIYASVRITAVAKNPLEGGNESRCVLPLPTVPTHRRSPPSYFYTAVCPGDQAPLNHKGEYSLSPSHKCAPPPTF